MFLVRLTSQLLRVVPQAGKVPWGQMGEMHTHPWVRNVGLSWFASAAGAEGLATKTPPASSKHLKGEV